MTQPLQKLYEECTIINNFNLKKTCEKVLEVFQRNTGNKEQSLSWGSPVLLCFTFLPFSHSCYILLPTPTLPL